MAGVAGLPETSNINGCDAIEAPKEPFEPAVDPGDCRTFPSLDLTCENDRRALHRARNRVAAQSADGHTYSNILELRENWEKCRPGDFAEQHIPRLMKVQEQRLVK